MAKRKIHLTISVEIDNPNVGEITDEMVENVINETDYKFENIDGFEIQTEIIDSNFQIP